MRASGLLCFAAVSLFSPSPPLHPQHLPSFSLSTPLQHQSRLTYPCRDKHARRALLERKLAEAEVAHDGHEAEARELFLSAIFHRRRRRNRCHRRVFLLRRCYHLRCHLHRHEKQRRCRYSCRRERGKQRQKTWRAGGEGRERGATETEERLLVAAIEERRSRSQRPRRLLQLSASTRRPPRQEAPRRSLAASQHGSGFEFVCGGASFDKFGK